MGTAEILFVYVPEHRILQATDSSLQAVNSQVQEKKAERCHIQTSLEENGINHLNCFYIKKYSEMMCLMKCQEEDKVAKIFQPYLSTNFYLCLMHEILIYS